MKAQNPVPKFYLVILLLNILATSTTLLAGFGGGFGGGFRGRGAAPQEPLDEAKRIIADGAEPNLVSSQFSFTEGPAANIVGDVYFTDQPNNKIYKWTADTGKITVFSDDCDRANGMFFAPDGKLIVCADLHNQLWEMDFNGNHTVLVKDYDGKLLNGPNDAWIRPNGGIYFTDPLFARSYWPAERGRTMYQDGQHVYYLSPDRKTLKRVAEDFRQPNGIIGTADAKTLYIADMGGNATYRYKINEDGTLSDKTLFCSQGSDGMTIDTSGNVYLTGMGVTVYNPEGQVIDRISTGRNRTANVTFAGKDRDMLFITAGTSIYTVKTKVKGVPAHKPIEDTDK